MKIFPLGMMYLASPHQGELASPYQGELACPHQGDPASTQKHNKINSVKFNTEMEKIHTTTFLMFRQEMLKEHKDRIYSIFIS
jgi:hypothetical protein